MVEFSRAQVAAHNKKEDLWMIINGAVLDVTVFCEEHPGGEEVLFEQGGLDATEAFDDVGHSDEARVLLAQYTVGKVLLSEKEKAKAAIKQSTAAATSALNNALPKTGATQDMMFDQIKMALPILVVGGLLGYMMFF